MILYVGGIVESGVALTEPAVEAEQTARSYRMDEETFEGFYRRTARPLWGYLARISGDGATADDLLQRTYYQFLRANLTTTEESQLRSYLYRIATNLMHDEWRQKSKQVALESVPEPSYLESHDLKWDMQKMFAELNPQERALIWLAHVDGTPHEEIAEKLGVQRGSVKVLLFRARKKLVQALKRNGLAPEEAR